MTGEGVVGEQPLLKPRDAYRYTSGCPLPTPSGSMRGTYGMQSDDGEALTWRSRSSAWTYRGARQVVN